jgi:putative membrane protein
VPSTAGEPGVEDATRRTHLAAERTWLAWWRTGLTSIAAGVGIGRLLPELTGGVTWPYVIVGAGYVLVGISMIVFAELRQRDMDAALREGRFDHLESTALRGFTICGVLLGLATLAVIVAQG